MFLKSSFKGEEGGGGGEVFRCTKTIPSSRIGLSRGESTGRGGKNWQRVCIGNGGLYRFNYRLIQASFVPHPE